MTESNTSAVLSLGTVVRLLAALGFFGGLVSAIIYAAFNLTNEPPGNLILALVFAPFFQALVLVVYALIGYPFYARLAANDRFTLGRLTFRT